MAADSSAASARAASLPGLNVAPFSFWGNPVPEGFGKSRIEAIADGIFAVAMTLLVLEIKLPAAESLPSHADLVHRLLALESSLTIYVISFLLLGMFWVSHHYQFHFVQRADRTLIWINLLLLLCITTIPFSTALLGQHANLWLPFFIYSVNLLLLVLFLFLNIDYLSRHPELASANLTPAVVRAFKARQLLFALVPVLSAVVAFYSSRAGLYLYFLLAPLHFLPKAGVRKARDDNKNP